MEDVPGCAPPEAARAGPGRTAQRRVERQNQEGVAVAGSARRLGPAVAVQSVAPALDGSVPGDAPARQPGLDDRLGRQVPDEPVRHRAQQRVRLIGEDHRQPRDVIGQPIDAQLGGDVVAAPVCVRRKRSSSAIPGEVTRKCGEPFMRSLHDGVRFWLLGIFGMLGIFGLPAAAGV